MPKRDNDDLEVIGDLAVDREDVRYRTTSRNEKAAPTPAPVKKSRGGGWFLFLLILGLAGVSGWLWMQLQAMQQELQQTTMVLESTRSQLESLGVELKDDVSETGTSIDKRLKFLDSEIRKLWDVSNKRNKKWIKDQGNQIASLDKKVKSVSSSQSKLDSTVKGFSGDIDKLQARQTSLQSETSGYNERILLLSGELELLQQRLASVPNDLDKRVAENEEAIVAIDASRSDMVRRLNELQSRLSQIQLKASGAPAQSGL